MKNIVRAAAFCGLLALSAPSFAQQQAASQVLNMKKAVLKMNLSSLIFKNGSFQYEIVTGPKTSFALGASYQPKSGLPFAKSLSDQFGDNADAQRAIETTQLSSFTVTPEYRFYLGSTATHGFYIAPFTRYQHLNFEQVYSFTASNGKVHTPLIGGTINNIGAGVLFGTQMSLGSNFTLDLWLAGPLYGVTNGNLSGTDDMSDLSAQDRAKLKTDIEGVNIPLTKLDATIGTNQIDVKLSGPYVGLRALGFTLGVRI